MSGEKWNNDQATHKVVCQVEDDEEPVRCEEWINDHVARITNHKVDEMKGQDGVQTCAAIPVALFTSTTMDDVDLDSLDDAALDAMGVANDALIADLLLQLAAAKDE